jgi:hypothetical protein
MGIPTITPVNPLNNQVHVPIEVLSSALATPKDGSSDAMTLNDKDNTSNPSADVGPGTASFIVTGQQDCSEEARGGEDGEGGVAEEELPPPLPPRPSLLKKTSRPSTSSSSGTTRPPLQAKATTAISSVDIQTLTFPDGTRGTFSVPVSRSVSESISVAGTSGGQNTPNKKISRSGSEYDDSASLMSYAPTLRANGDLASLLDEGLTSQSPAWKLLISQSEDANPFENVEYNDISLANFEQEFDDIAAVDSKEGGNEGRLVVSHRN